jgi:hypothetical protein
MFRNITIAIAVLGTFTLNPLAQGLRSEGLRETHLVTRDTGGRDDMGHDGMSELSAREGTAGSSMPEDAQRQRLEDGEDGDEVITAAVIIGFVAGFVRQDNAKHPEVQFAVYLRERYTSSVYTEVFSSHAGRKAYRQVLRLLDTGHDGTLTTTEKQQARIIICGHSWGAAEAVWLARELGRNGIPVQLTIQIDTIAKPGQKGSTISPNLENAANFYQPKGLFHGPAEILAADPARTKIIGNFRMAYDDDPLRSDNYPWYARILNKPHREIEDDPRVWDQAASLIDSALSSMGPTVQASSPSESPLFDFPYGPPAMSRTRKGTAS